MDPWSIRKMLTLIKQIPIKKNDIIYKKNAQCDFLYIVWQGVVGVFEKGRQRSIIG